MMLSYTVLFSAGRFAVNVMIAYLVRFLLLLRSPFTTGGHDSTRHPSFIGISTDGSFLSRHRPVSKCLSPLGLLDCFFIGYRSSLTVPAISCPGCISGIPNTSRYSSLFARMAGVEPAPTGSALRCHYATSSRSSR